MRLLRRRQIAHEGRRSEQANSGICFGFVVVVAKIVCASCYASIDAAEETLRETQHRDAIGWRTNNDSLLRHSFSLLPFLPLIHAIVHETYTRVCQRLYWRFDFLLFLRSYRPFSPAILCIQVKNNVYYMLLMAIWFTWRPTTSTSYVIRNTRHKVARRCSAPNYSCFVFTFFFSLATSHLVRPSSPLPSTT